MEDRPLTQSFISTEWRFILSIVAPVVAVVLAWGVAQTKLAVLEQRLDEINGNDLKHIQMSLDRIEEQHLKLMVEVAEIKVLINPKK